MYTTDLSEPVENLPPALGMVKKSLGYISKPYVSMGNAHSNSTTKFSTKGFEEDTYSTVNVTFEYRRCVVTCTNGMCSVQMHNRKKVPKSSKVTNVKSHCSNVHMFVLHIDTIQSYFPEYFGWDIEVLEGKQDMTVVKTHNNYIHNKKMDRKKMKETLILKLDCGHFLHSLLLNPKK